MQEIPSLLFGLKALGESRASQIQAQGVSCLALDSSAAVFPSHNQYTAFLALV
jgi:hypothetical protein